MRRFQKRMSLLQKLISVILTVVFVPILIIGIMATGISKTALEEQSRKSKETLASQTADMIDREMDRIDQMFLQVSLSTAFQDVVNNLEPKKGFSSKEKAEWDMERKKLLQVLDKEIQSITITNQFISSLSLMYVTGDVIGPVSILPEGVTDIRKTFVYQKLIGSTDMIWLTEAEVDTYVNSGHLTVGKAVKSFYYSNTEAVGAVKIELNYDAFQSILAKIKVGENDSSYLIASNGSRISSLPYDEMVQREEEPVLAEVEERARLVDADTFISEVNGTSTIITYNKCDKSGFIYIIMHPESEVLQGSNEIKNLIFLVGVAFSALAVLGGLFFALNMTKALKNVEKTMSLSAEGDLTVTAGTMRTDEIGKVAGSFNTMVKSIRALISQSNKLSEEVSKTAESLSKISAATTRTASEITSAIDDIAMGAGMQSEEIDSSVQIFSGLADGISNAVSSTNAMECAARNVKDYTAEGIQAAQLLDGKALEVISITEGVAEQISGLAESITVISEFTEILNTTSEQTGLLSLNASIEAARAGEHGRGFTVVAEEIRKLAEQSGRHTEKIENLTKEILSKTKASTEFILKANTVIKEQAESSKVSAEYFSKIDMAMNELLQDIKKIMEVIHKIDKDKDNVLGSINHIAEASEAAAAASEEVSASTQEQLNILEELAGMATMLKDCSKNLEGNLKRFTV